MSQRSRSRSQPKKRTFKPPVAEGEENLRKLFISGLSDEATDQQLKDLFVQAGQITYSLLKKPEGKPCFAFVEYSTVEEAQKAVELFNGKSHGEKTLRVNIAKPKRPKMNDENNESNNQVNVKNESKNFKFDKKGYPRNDQNQEKRKFEEKKPREIDRNDVFGKKKRYVGYSKKEFTKENQQKPEKKNLVESIEEDKKITEEAKNYNKSSQEANVNIKKVQKEAPVTIVDEEKIEKAQKVVKNIPEQPKKEKCEPISKISEPIQKKEKVFQQNNKKFDKVEVKEPKGFERTQKVEQKQKEQLPKISEKVVEQKKCGKILDLGKKSQIEEEIDY